MHELPSYHSLMLPLLRAVVDLGGSGAAREISAAVVEAEGFTDEELGISYEGRDKSILLDRLDWARSYCKLGGVLESPRRGLFLVTDLGRDISSRSDDDARDMLLEIDRDVRRRRNRKSDASAESKEVISDEPVANEEEDEAWREILLTRLHQLTPDGFERFVMFLLRSTGMELRRMGGPGDEGVDGIGVAPLTSVLTKTIAVQAKRYEPSKTVGRETVALFQSDAHAAGAEHGVLVTTARFSEPARKAALGRHPTIDLVDGEKLVDLCLEHEVGVRALPVVSSDFFNRFDE